MFSALLNKVVPAKRKLVNRRFEPSLFTNPEHQQQLSEKGYAHIKNVLSADEVRMLTDLYEQARGKPGFQHTDYYINTIGFDDPNIRAFLKGRTEAILKNILPRFIDVSKAAFPLGGGFCINPPDAVRGCNPHQDPTCVDELTSYSMTTWISLGDMTPENGCLYIIPGSHLWGNLHRSVCIPWAFEKQADYLWKFLKPVPTKAGDILCFDVSTIHSSTRNQTKQTRLAMTVQTIPSNSQLISYFPSKGNKADVYNIDQDYFIQESQYAKPSAKYTVARSVSLSNPFSASDIDELMQAYHQFKFQ